MPTMTQLTERQRAQLIQQDAANLQQISRAYLVMYDRLSGDVDALVEALAEGATEAEVKQLPEYKRLVRWIEPKGDVRCPPGGPPPWSRPSPQDSAPPASARRTAETCARPGSG